MNEVRASVRFLVLVPLLAALAAGAGEAALRREGRVAVDPAAADGAAPAEGPAGAPVRRSAGEPPRRPTRRSATDVAAESGPPHSLVQTYTSS